MSDIFVSYAREDRQRVEPIVRMLEENGWSVWWDRDIVPGQRFEAVIDREISAATCVVVAWSKHSIDSDWVRTEALEGMERGVLVPISLDDARVPFAFRRYHTADFKRWPRVDDLEIEQFLGAVAAITQSNETPKLPARPSRRGRYVAMGIGGAVFAMALILAGTFLPLTRTDDQPMAGAAPINATRSLAVVELAAPNELARSLAAGISDELKRSLARLGELDVLDAVARRGEGLVELSEFSRRLQTRYLVTGRVLGVDPIELGMTVYDGAENRVLSERQYVTQRDELLKTNMQIVRDVVTSLDTELGSRSRQRLNTPPTRQPRAYLAYLDAKEALRQPLDESVLQEAMAGLERAIELDSSFSQAYATLCSAKIRRYEASRAMTMFEEAERSCHRALTLDADSAEVHKAMADLYRYSSQQEKAIDSYTRALSIRPTMVDAYIGLAWTFAEQGKSQAAVSAFTQAIAMQPGYWAAYNALGVYYSQAGEFLDAINQFDQASKLAPNNAATFNNLGAVRFFVGDFEGAVASWTRADELEQTSSSISNLGTAHYFLGNFEKAAALYEEAVDRRPDDHRLWGNLGDARRFSGVDREAEMAAYETAARLADEALSINRTAQNLASTAFYNAVIGNESRAKAMLGEARAASSQDLYTAYDIARTARILDEPDVSSLLANAIERGYSPVLLAADPFFEGLPIPGESNKLNSPDHQ